MNQNFKGIYFKLLNCLIFPIITILLVKLTNRVSSFQIFFLQLSIGAFLSFIFLKILKVKISFPSTKKEFLLYFVRAALNLMALSLWIHSVKNIEISEATVISYSGPLWVSLLAVTFLKEKFNLGIIFLFCLNIIGMLIAIKPKLTGFNFYPALSALLAIIMWSVYEIICKIQTKNQHFMQQSFLFMLFSAILLAPFILLKWQAFSLSLMPTIFAISALAVANVTVIFIAYSLTPILVLAPFSYARIIFTACLAFVFLDQTPSIEVFLGSAVILFANIGYLILKNKKMS